MKRTIASIAVFAFVSSSCVSERTNEMNPNGGGLGSQDQALPWQSLAKQISALESEESSREDWSALAVSSEQINDENRLRGVVRTLDEGAKREAELFFEKYHDTYYFEFEIAYRALVFFDGSGIQKQVIKW